MASAMAFLQQKADFRCASRPTSNRRRVSVRLSPSCESYVLSKASLQQEDRVPLASTSPAFWALTACTASCSIALTLALPPPCPANPYLESKKTIVLGVTSDRLVLDKHMYITSHRITSAHLLAALQLNTIYSYDLLTTNSQCACIRVSDAAPPKLLLRQ